MALLVVVLELRSSESTGEGAEYGMSASNVFSSKHSCSTASYGTEQAAVTLWPSWALSGIGVVRVGRVGLLVIRALLGELCRRD